MAAGDLTAGGGGSILVVTSSVREAGQAARQLFDAVAERTLRYVPRPALDAAVAGARQRTLGDAWAWSRRAVSVDISPLVAVTLAAWGHATRAHTYQREPSIYI